MHFRLLEMRRRRDVIHSITGKQIARKRTTSDARIRVTCLKISNRNLGILQHILKLKHLLGLCLPSFWQCDGQADCLDGSDENATLCNPSTTSKPCDQSLMFTCQSGQCIPHRWVCDGTPECSDGSDEKGKGAVGLGRGRIILDIVFLSSFSKLRNEQIFFSDTIHNIVNLAVAKKLLSAREHVNDYA
jgi:hypothetical protein